MCTLQLEHVRYLTSDFPQDHDDKTAEEGPSKVMKMMPKARPPSTPPLYKGSAAGGFGSTSSASTWLQAGSQELPDDGTQEVQDDASWWSQQGQDDGATAWTAASWSYHPGWTEGAWNEADGWREVDPTTTRPAEPEIPPLEGRKGQEGRYVAGGFVTADGVFHGYLCLYGQSDCLMISANSNYRLCL